MGKGNAEAFYRLFQCCNVHGFGEMFVHAGFLRVNAVYLLNKGFYLLIRCHKGDGFVSTVFFAVSVLPPQAVSAAVAAVMPQTWKNERREIFFII